VNFCWHTSLTLSFQAAGIILNEQHRRPVQELPSWFQYVKRYEHAVGMLEAPGALISDIVIFTV
jgi:hypothetical protein